jgi:uncharacterized cupin superfamily protein
MREHVINLDEVELQPHGHGTDFEAKLGPIGRRVGARKLGYRLTVVPPGKRAWPYHCHHNNEEMFFILAGTGTLRIGEERIPLRAGDVVCAPEGGPETAHQILNDGSGELRYLAVSTMEGPDVFEYPDSGKFGVFAGPKQQPRFTFYGRPGSAVDYWDGE